MAQVCATQFCVIRGSLGALMNRGILREEEGGGDIKMRFEDPFFARWIAMFTARI
jgi:hypothetical protein